uniref:Uncharacterized protein n=1 Tax=Timema shepardi TaxID=629360 RepID=A0A7R9AL13_TIMSH|nr:unnamed protein product [Timema shepardi]
MVHTTEIRTSISPSSAVELNTTSALAKYATEILRRDCLLHDVIEGKVEGKRSLGRKRIHEGNQKILGDQVVDREHGHLFPSVLSINVGVLVEINCTTKMSSGASVSPDPVTSSDKVDVEEEAAPDEEHGRIKKAVPLETSSVAVDPLCLVQSEDVSGSPGHGNPSRSESMLRLNQQEAMWGEQLLKQAVADLGGTGSDHDGSDSELSDSEHFLAKGAFLLTPSHELSIEKASTICEKMNFKGLFSLTKTATGILFKFSEAEDYQAVQGYVLLYQEPDSRALVMVTYQHYISLYPEKGEGEEQGRGEEHNWVMMEGIGKVELEEVNPNLRGGRVEKHLGKNTPVHPTEIQTSISPSSADELNTTSALASYATEAERKWKTILEKTNLSTPDPDSILNIPVIGSIVYFVPIPCRPQKTFCVFVLEIPEDIPEEDIRHSLYKFHSVVEVSRLTKENQPAGSGGQQGSQSQSSGNQSSVVFQNSLRICVEGLCWFVDMIKYEGVRNLRCGNVIRSASQGYASSVRCCGFLQDSASDH